MDPFVVYLTVVIAGLAGYAGWVTKAFISHLMEENKALWRNAHRGAAVAEKAADVLE